MPEEVRPVNRKEAIIAGESVTPVTREEAILKKESVTPLSREEYYLKELADGQGGGGLDYVIPEQTLTFATIDSKVEIEENGLDEIQGQGSSFVAKVYYDAQQFTEYWQVFYQGEGSLESTGSIFFYKEDNKWKAMLQVQQAPYPLTSTISAIRGF